MTIPYPIRKVIAPLLKIAPNNRLKTIATILELKNTEAAYLAAMSGTSSTWHSSKDHLEISERQYLEHNHKNLFGEKHSKLNN